MNLEKSISNDIGNALSHIKQLFSSLDREVLKSGQAPTGESVAIAQQTFHEFIHLTNDKIGLSSKLDFFTKQKIGAWLQQEILPYLLLSKTAERFYSKPLGYAGDYMTINMVYENAGKGHGRIGAFVDQFFMETPAAKAVRNRRKLLSEEIEEIVKKNNGNEVKITSLACGPSKEIFDVYKSKEKTKNLKTTLVDFDKQAINFVNTNNKKHNLEDKIKLTQENILHLALGRKTLNICDNDLIYSLGLIDYFQDKIVIKLLNWIHQGLKPGGKVILGNFHPNNCCKVFMDYVLEWKLIHRNEEEISNLFQKSAFNRPPTKIYFEDQGINLFAECIKE
jgi:SAM-dependent methyltransferase